MAGNKTRALSEFKRLKCIKFMEEHHLDIWETLVKSVGETLDTPSILHFTAYTPHNFSNHCFNIYRIVSNVLLYEDSFKDKPELSSEALLLLNVAILFHDFSMTTPGFSESDRLQHSKLSAEKFEKYCCDRNEIALEDKQIQIIKCLIIAHSDIKEKVGSVEKTVDYTLKSKNLKQKQKGYSEEIIHTKFLAGLLRLADEFDITEDRAGRFKNQIDALDIMDPQQKFSKECWEKLLYFENVRFQDGKAVYEIKEAVYNRDTMKSDNIIRETISKLRREFQMINEECFDTGNLGRLVSVHKIEIWLGEKSYTPTEKKSTTITVDTDTAQVLDKHIYNNNALISGHFNVNDNVCATDWIDIKTILKNRDMRNIISDAFVVSIKSNPAFDLSNCTNDFLLVGIDVNGSVIVSEIAFDLNLPFSYIIPNKLKSKFSMQDKKFVSGNYKKIILFTDAIVTWETVSKVISDNNIKEKVVGIYSIFTRKIRNTGTFTDDDTAKAHSYESSVEKLYKFSLNDSFDITIFPKKGCPVGALSDRLSKDFRCLDCNKLYV